MSDIRVYYADQGGVVSSGNDPASRQFYSDFLLIDRPLDAFGSLEEVKECEWTSQEHEFLFSSQRGLVALFKSCSIQAENGQSISIWKDESGYGNDIVTQSGTTKISNGYVDLTSYNNDENYEVQFSRKSASGMLRDFTSVCCFKVVDGEGIVEIDSAFSYIEIGFGSDKYVTFSCESITKNDASVYNPASVAVDVENSVFCDWTVLTVKCNEQHINVRINNSTVKTIQMPDAGWAWRNPYGTSPEIGCRNPNMGSDAAPTINVASLICFSTDLSDEDCVFVESFLLERVRNV